MALGTPVLARPTMEQRVVRPAQIPAEWVDIIDNGGLETLDSATITDPEAEINNSTTRIFKVGKSGTTLRLRMKYDDGNTTTTTSPTIRVYGRTGENALWQILTTKDSNTSVEITVADTTDVSDGTDNTTYVDPDKHTWDLDGCDEILVGVEIVYAVSVGDATLSTLQAKII